MGRIGRRVVELLRPLGYRVGFWDPFVDDDAAPGTKCFDSLEELASWSDYLTVHLPLTEDTRGLVGEGELRALGASGYLVNVSRGGLVDEEALLGALNRGQLAGAALDVLASEPPQPGSTSLQLAQHPRVLATPHIAYSSVEAEDRLRRMAAQQVKGYLE